MQLVIVPNVVSEQIHAAIDKALGGRPCSDEERDSIYRQLLEYFDVHGVIPDFTLVGNPEAKFVK